MTDDRKEMFELMVQISKLPPEQQLAIAQDILSHIRRNHFTASL